MIIIHIVKLIPGHSSGFNKQVPSLVKANPNNYIYNTGSKSVNNKENHISLFMLLKYLMCKKVVIFHFHSLLSLKSVIIATFSLFFNKKIVYSPRGEFRHSAILSNSCLKKCLFFKLIKPVLKRASIHFLSEVEYSEYVFLNGTPSNYVVIPNAILIEENEMSKMIVNKSAEEYTILYVGRILVELKNIRLLITSINDLQQKISTVSNIELKIQIVGSFGSLNEKIKFFNLIKAHNIVNKFEVISEVPNYEISRFMKNADLLYNMSFSEGFPNIVLEALNNGLPVICSQNTGIQHYFINSKVVKFCSLSSTDFINTVFNLITSKNVEFEVKDFDISRYNLNTIQKDFFKFYSSLC